MSHPTKRQRWRTSATMQARARQLRCEQTPAEALLWEHLRNRRFMGLKFRRQHPLGRFVADFYCAQHRLVVELDGAVHQKRGEYDDLRTEELEAKGYRVLCFTNSQVVQDLEWVLEQIARACAG